MIFINNYKWKKINLFRKPCKKSIKNLLQNWSVSWNLLPKLVKFAPFSWCYLKISPKKKNNIGKLFRKLLVQPILFKDVPILTSNLLKWKNYQQSWKPWKTVNWTNLNIQKNWNVSQWLQLNSINGSYMWLMSFRKSKNDLSQPYFL